MKNKMCPGTLTYHPNISSGLQLCIDPVAPEVRVHLQTCGLGKVNIGLEANSCNYVIDPKLFIKMLQVTFTGGPAKESTVHSIRVAF